jgi:hypothetical protein
LQPVYIHPLFKSSAVATSEIAIAKLKNYKSPISDQIPAELIQAGDNIGTIKKYRNLN